MHESVLALCVAAAVLVRLDYGAAGRPWAGFGCLVINARSQ